MNDTSRYCCGTVASDRPMTPLLSFRSHENDVVRWPDSIFLRRLIKTNCENIPGHVS